MTYPFSIDCKTLQLGAAPGEMLAGIHICIHHLQVLLDQVDNVLMEWPEVGVTEGFDAARAQWLGGIQHLVLTLRVRF
jgi:hypothetical protein